MDKVTIEAVNLKRTHEALLKASGNFLNHIANALYALGEETMTESKEIVPVGKTGNLESTGHVTQPEIKGSDINMEMGYGGTAAKGAEVGYAKYVHEMDNETTHWTRPGSQSHYLSEPLEEKLKDADRYMADFIEEALEVLKQ